MGGLHDFLIAHKTINQRGGNVGQASRLPGARPGASRRVRLASLGRAGETPALRCGSSKSANEHAALTEL